MSNPNDFVIENGVLKKYNGPGGDVVVPNGVTSIGSDAFWHCSGLTSVTIPDSVTSIGRSAFYGCTRLTSVTIPDSVTSIGGFAFYGCTRLTSVTISDSVTSIGDRAFEDCSSLTSITLPEGLTSIGDGAFSSCSSLTIVSLPDSLVEIGNRVFSWCSSLTAVSIPNGVERIGTQAFERCTALSEIKLPDNLKAINNAAFSNCRSLKHITLPEGLIAVGAEAFGDCEKLSDIVFPSSVRVIGNKAFSNTAFEKKIALLSDGTMYFGNALIRANPSLHGRYTVKDGTACIAFNAFSGCYNLTEVELPESIESIGNEAFSKCMNLTKINLPAHLPGISAGLFKSCSSLASIGIPDSVTTIGREAFCGCGALERVQLPKGLTEIGETAFANCNNLTEITVPEGVSCIEAQSFRNCSNLAVVMIPNAVQRIGYAAFSGCSSLKKLVLPDGVISIGSSAFEGCSSLEEVSLPKVLDCIDSNTFSGCNCLTSVTLPPHITKIENGAFSGCSNLGQLILPDTVTLIGSNAFDGCVALSDVTLPGKLPEFMSGAFKGCSAIRLSLPGEITETKEPLSGELARGSIETTDAGFAHLILFQRTPLWKAWKNASNIPHPAGVFEQMLALVGEFEKPDTKLGGPVAEFIMKYRTKLPREKLQTMLTMFQCVKSKEMNALQKDTALQDYLSGKEEAVNPAEEAAHALLERIGAEPSIEKVVNKGVRYRDSKVVCSRDVLISVLSSYAKEWKRCAEGDWGEMGTVEVLKDASRVNIDPLADQIAAALDPRELSVFLEKRIAGSAYRPYLLAWARFADEESVKQQTATYKSQLRGRASEQFFARNLAEALMISPTREAMLFFDKNDLLERFAAYRGTTAMELRDTAMLPDFGFDPTGTKLFDIGGNIIEVRLTDRLGFELFDREKGKTVRAFPKKSSDPTKAQAAAEAYKDFKKQILDFAKLRTEQLCRMHQSGENVRPELWQEVYLKHPVVKLLAERLIWMDEAGTSFIVKDGAAKDAALNPVEPTGPVHVAHVMELSAAQADAWRHTLASLGCAQLFEQVWEPVIAWEPQDLPNRYRGIEISSKVRNALKATLKQRGIDVHAGEIDREFDAHRWKYEFSSDNTMYFSKCFRLDYTVYETDGSLTLGKASLGEQPNARELNAVLLELDRITTMERVKQDDPSVMQLMHEFTLAQITDFISAAQEASATNVLAALLDYKNANFSDFDPMDEFTLEW